MQLMLILGVAFAIASVMFALQNNIPATVTFALWRFDSSLAMILLLALGLGVLITALVSSPSVIKLRWANSRLKSQIKNLELECAASRQRIEEIKVELERLDGQNTSDPADIKPYVGLKALIAGKGPERP